MIPKTDILPRSLRSHSTIYILTELLVQTANATLFLGYNKTSPNTLLVFKRLPRDSCAKLEADIHRSLPDSPFHIPLIDLALTRDNIYLVLPYYRNGDLFDLIMTVHQNEEISVAVKEEWVMNVFSQMVEAVMWLHRQGVYHRDLKPENFLIDDEGRLRIADFGLATKDIRNSALGFGSEFYMGPESFSTKKHILHRPVPSKSDVWSLGILLLNLLRGRNPWPRAEPSDAAFAEYLRRPSALRDAFGLTEQAWRLVSRMLCINVLKRADMREIMRLSKRITRWTVDEDVETYYGEEDDYYPQYTADSAYYTEDTPALTAKEQYLDDIVHKSYTSRPSSAGSIITADDEPMTPPAIMSPVDAKVSMRDQMEAHLQYAGIPAQDNTFDVSKMLSSRQPAWTSFSPCLGAVY